MNKLVLDAYMTRQAMDKLDAAMRAGGCTTNFDEYLTHYFGHGTYVREMRIPKDTLITGKCHRYQEVCVLTKGIILVKAEGKKDSAVYQAPYTFIAAPGKKVLYILENAIFLNILPNPNNLTDLAELEAELIIPDKLVLEAVS